MIVIVSVSVSVKYIFVISPADAFSFLDVVKELITLPATLVSLNCGAAFAVTVTYIVFNVKAPIVSVALMITGCANSPSPLLVVLNAVTVGNTASFNTPATIFT